MSRVDDQIAIERMGLAGGFEKYTTQLRQLRSQRKEEIVGVPEIRLVERTIPDLAEAIRQLREATLQGGAGVGVRSWGPKLWALYKAGLDDPTLAAITLMVAVNHAVTRNIAVDVSLAIGKRVEMEYQWRSVSEQNKELVENVTRWVKHVNTKIARQIITLSDKVPTEWSQEDQLFLGSALLNLLINHTSVFKLYKVRDERGRTKSTLQFTTETLEVIEGMHRAIGMSQPIYPPMIVEPRPYTPTDFGGYYLLKTEAVKGGHSGSQMLEESEHLRALNFLQTTRWRINREVYAVLSDLVKDGGRVAGLPNFGEPDIPPKVFNDDEDKVKENKKLRARAWDQHHKENLPKAVATSLSLGVAKSFLDTPFYIPWNCDWRGRMYPLISYLHPHSDPKTKAMLVFDRAVPLGEHGLDLPPRFIPPTELV